jgi:hypothetical protein
VQPNKRLHRRRPTGGPADSKSGPPRVTAGCQAATRVHDHALGVDEPGIPSGVAIVGSDDATGEYFMLYFDERGVSRKYDGTIRDDGRTIIGKGQLSSDGA